MINFRYHVVSLTAVFLALVIGVAMGTTVVSKATVDGLRSNLSKVEARSDSVSKSNVQLLTRLDWANRQDQGLTDQMLTTTVRDALKDVPVLVIASKDVDRSVITRSLSALSAAGAKVDGTLVVNDRLLLKGENKARLAEALHVDPGGNVARTLLSRLSAVLASKASIPGVGPTTSTSTSTSTTAPAADPGATVPDATEPPVAPPTTVVPEPEPILISALLKAGFLDFRPLVGQPVDGQVLTAPSYRYLVISSAEPNVPNDEFLNPLISDLAKFGPVPLVAASAADGDDPAKTRNDFITPLLAMANVKGRISTVDNLETFAGLIGVVYALAEVGVGRHGQYGLGKGVSAVVPTPVS